MHSAVDIIAITTGVALATLNIRVVQSNALSPYRATTPMAYGLTGKVVPPPPEVVEIAVKTSQDKNVANW
jgi:hypothetical protein